jgi:hypothetical protein
MIVLIFFCGAVGYALAGNDINIWGVLVFTLAAAAALQLAYLITVLAHMH